MKGRPDPKRKRVSVAFIPIQDVQVGDYCQTRGELSVQLVIREDEYHVVVQAASGEQTVPRAALAAAIRILLFNDREVQGPPRQSQHS